MKKMQKTLISILVAVLVLVITVAVLIGLFAESALKVGIETGATKTLNVGTTLQGVDLSIMQGKLGLRELVIDNPPGYQNKTLLELNDGRVQVDIKSLLSDTVNIKDITLDGITLTIEQRGVSSNNLQDVMKGISSGEEPKETPTSKTEKQGKKLHIDNLSITNIKVKAKLLPIPGKADTLELPLTPIKMTNIGSGEDVDTAALAKKIFLAIVDKIAKEGAGILPSDITGPLKDQLKNITDISGTILKGGTDAGKDVLKEGEGILKQGQDIGKGVKEGIGGLFKKD